MILNCIGIGADEEESLVSPRRKARIDRDSEDWNQSATTFLVCSSILSFVSILKFVLHLSLSNSKVFE